MIRNKTNIKNIKNDDEYIEIPFSFILEVLLVSFILLKTSGAFVSFTAFGSIIIIYTLFKYFFESDNKSEESYKVNTYKYSEYRKNAC